mmetsp:Transcript_56449/g.129623  ORF Transcript_56449/g.129623 Transcript_56449/m.129623 type:complete len:219 (-) Transcript_56449:355-1011(-)
MAIPSRSRNSLLRRRRLPHHPHTRAPPQRRAARVGDVASPRAHSPPLYASRRSVTCARRWWVSSRALSTRRRLTWSSATTPRSRSRRTLTASRKRRQSGGSSENIRLRSPHRWRSGWRSCATTRPWAAPCATIRPAQVLRPPTVHGGAIVHRWRVKTASTLSRSDAAQLLRSTPRRCSEGSSMGSAPRCARACTGDASHGTTTPPRLLCRRRHRTRHL